MGIVMRVVLMASIYVLCLSSVVRASTGDAVFFKRPYTPSKCYGNRNSGVMIAGVREELWNNGAACGRRYRVRCIGGANKAPHPCKPGRSVDVTVVDLCKAVCNGIINLSQDAFAVIADPDAGVVRVDYTQI